MTKDAADSAARTELERGIGEAMLRDRPGFRRRLRRLRRGDEAGRRGLEADVARSRAVRAARAARLPAPGFPPELPVSAARERIAGAVERHQVVVVCGETGSGKTTQLPKICLAAGRGAAGWIGHTQPRRVAARSVASRIARELGTRVGGPVGCKVRFHEEVGADTCLKVMTDGILVAEIARDRRLEAYDTLIIDEAHERSLNVDLLLGHVKGLLPRRPELRVIVSSATLDPERIANFFGGAPVIDVAGRVFPVEVRYAEPGSVPEDPVAAVPETVRALAEEGPGDVLAFLPGERDIRETAQVLRADRALQVLPLYARLNHAQQERVFRPGERRRVVLATNVAETSITVPGIRFVVDTGLARVSRYSFRTRVQYLPVEPISRAAADQRRGRCGRVGPGVCVRLYSREDFERRPRSAEPEIRRTNLASVILRMAANRLGRIDDFAFIDPPDRRFVADGYRLLRELGALDADDRVTPLGRRLARLPVDPRIGRMILAAGELGCVDEVLVIGAALSAGDPRESSPETRAQAAAAHRRFTDPRSDFMGYLNLWRLLDGAGGGRRSRVKWREFCAEYHLSARRTREWADLYRQLLIAARELRLRPAPRAAAYAQIHRAVLAGHVSHVGVRSQGREYRGPRGRTFLLSPASSVKPAGPQWIVAAGLVETSAVYAHAAARIRPQWIERAARDLVMREYFEPRFDPKRGEVMASERVVLFGLTLVPRRRVRFGPVEPEAARTIFITEGLVAGRLATGAPFERRNRAAIDAVHALESKARRRDLLAGDDARARFFEACLPPDVASERGFRRWHDSLPGPGCLCFGPTDLIRPGARLPAAEDFPDTIEVSGVPVDLVYRFAPGEPDDGITARIALAVLGALETERFEWLVPGRQEEKALALLRTLPPALRRRIAPLRDAARRCLARMMQPSSIVSADLPEAAGGGLASRFERRPPTPPLGDFAVRNRGRSGRSGRREGNRLVSCESGSAAPPMCPEPGDPRVGRARARGFAGALAAALKEVAGVEVEPERLQSGLLSPDLHMRFEVLGPDGKVLGHGRDLDALKDRFRAPAARSFRRAAERTFERAGLTGWCFEDLPPHVDSVDAGVRFRGYPALEDHGASVALRLFDEPRRAAAAHRAGLLRLAMLALGRELRAVRRKLGRMERLALRYLRVPAAPWSGEGEGAPAVPAPGGFAKNEAGAPLATRNLADASELPAAGGPVATPVEPFAAAPDIEGELLQRAVLECCFANEEGAGGGVAAVRTRTEFERRLAVARPRLEAAGAALRDLADRILAAWEAVRAARAGLDDRSYPESLADFDEQLAWLVYRGFIAATPLARLEALPRYLQAARRRLEKLPRNPARDLEAVRVQRRAWEPVRGELLAFMRSGEPPDPVRMECRWMLEELRVSLFVQEMGTRYPVSVPRIERAWAARPAPATPGPGRGGRRSRPAPASGKDSGASPGGHARG